MRVLIAEDDVVSARALTGLVLSWDFRCTTVSHGDAALEIMLGDNPPDIALLDWMMPGMEGVELCRQTRQQRPALAIYIILLTSRDTSAAAVMGLDAGADDYLTKPFDPGELSARMRAGARIVTLQKELTAKVAALESTLANVKQLNGLLPICMYCKAIRDDSDYWHRVEQYVSEHSQAQFSHGICPACVETIVNPALAELQQER